MSAVNSAALSDGELVARCRIGDRAAWDALIERFSRYVFAIATQGYRLAEADAEEVFQEVFARTYERLETLRDDDAVRPWIAQLTRRLSVDRIRAGGRERLVDEAPERPELDVALARIDEALSVRHALATLPDHCREVLDRFYARDETYAVIGAALEIPPGTIASRISRCLEKLRDRLAAEPVASGGAG